MGKAKENLNGVIWQRKLPIFKKQYKYLFVMLIIFVFASVNIVL